MTSNYAQQSALVIKAIPIIAKEDIFALKGGTAINMRKLSASPKTQALFGAAKINVLSRAELYGGKFCAALDRQHPRDLFDVAQFYKTSTITDAIKSGFLALALGHNRPLHELLNPTLQDHGGCAN